MKEKHGLVVMFNDANGNSTSAWRSFSGTIEEGFDILSNNAVNSVELTEGWDEMYGLPDNDSKCYWYWGDGMIAEFNGSRQVTGKFQKIDGKWVQTEKDGLPVEDIEHFEKLWAEPLPEIEEIPLEITA